MKEKRTPEKVKNILDAFFREKGRMPSYGELLALLGVRSKSVVNFWVNKLIRAGMIGKDVHGHLTFAKRALAIPMLGSVQAGFPSPEEEALCDIISMDEYLVARPESMFLLQVSGDSMTGAGILEGDLVIVEKGREPKNGDVVIAEVDGEWTMKYFSREKGGRVVLQAANPKYPVIKPKSELKLGGVVTAVIRKYHQ